MSGFVTRHRTLARFFSLVLLAGSLVALRYCFAIDDVDIDLGRLYLHIAAGVAGFLMLFGCIALYSATAPAAETPATAVLAEWTLAPDEWRAFSAVEAARLRDNAAWTGSFLAIIGGMLGLTPSGGRLDFAAAGAALLGIPGYVAVRTAAHLRSRRVPRAGARVVVRRDTVEIDGRRVTVRSRSRRLHSVRLRRDLLLPALEVKTEYDTTHNFKPATDNYIFYVPIPWGRESEGMYVAERLMRAAWEARDRDDGPETGVSRTEVGMQ